MNDAQVCQWLFGLDCIARGFNWPVDVFSLGDAKRKLDGLLANKATAKQVSDAYELLRDAVGPQAFQAMLASDDALPLVNCTTNEPEVPPRWLALYVDPASNIVAAKATTVWGEFPAISINPKEELTNGSP